MSGLIGQPQRHAAEKPAGPVKPVDRLDRDALLCFGHPSALR